MSVKRGVQLRRCSLCGKTGHNRAKCLLSLKKEKVEKSAEIKENLKLSKKPKAVFIKTFDKYSHSPHVVDLKKSSNQRKDFEMPVFCELKKSKNVLPIVDLATLVRTANAQKNETEVVVKVRTNKKVLLKNKVSIKQILIKYKKNIKDGFNNLLLKIKQTRDSIFEGVNFKLKSLNYKRLVYVSLVLFILAALPFPAIGYYRQVRNVSAQVVAESTDAFLALQSSTVAAFKANLPQAENDLNQALKSFGQAKNILENEHQLLQYVAGLLPIIGSEVEGRQRLLNAGHNLALGNTYLVKGISETQKTEEALTERLNIFSNHLRSALPQYREALEQLAGVDVKILPVEYQKTFTDFKILFSALIEDLQKLVELSSSINNIFGGDGLRRYLLVFQNQHELRPTGGFMGSFAILDVQKGKIMNLEIPGGGTYDLQGQFNVFVKPPLPLQLVNKRWEFQDANWFPDFSASAQKIEWFYEQGRQNTMDGVIAINASVLERLLKVVGSITASQNDFILSADKGIEDLQYEVEKDYDLVENKPKAVLGELADQFLERFKQLKAVDAILLLTELQEALEQKEIQVYFNDPLVQSRFQQFGWTGEILNISDHQDYLSVVTANLQGQKSDAKIKQVIEHQVLIEEDGSVLDTVVIHRRHFGTPGELFYGSANINYLRVYVPENSELLAAGGFTYPPEEAFKVPEDWYGDDLDLEKNEQLVKVDTLTGTRVTKEFGKTVFGNWFVVNPGEASSVYFTYRLPFKIDLDNSIQTWPQKVGSWFSLATGANSSGARYSLLVQKQSGINSDFSTRVIFPDFWEPVWQTGTNMNLALNGAEYSGVLNTDQIFGLVMQKNN